MAAEKRIIRQGDDTPLPEPGHKRREALKMRLEKLNAEAAELASELEVETVDPSKIEPDREIIQHFNSGDLPVSNRQEGFEYCWVFSDPRNNQAGRHVFKKRYQGWEVVSASMPEAADHKHVDGTRRVGDVLLMRIRYDRYVKLRREERETLKRREAGVSEGFMELGAKHARHGVKVYDTVPDNAMKHAQATAAEERATRMTNKWMKDGNMPGVPAPGREKN